MLLFNINAVLAQELAVEVNGKAIDFPDAGPFIDKNGRTLVPVRFVVQALGAEVGWDGQAKRVTISKGDTTLEFKTGQNRIFVNEEEREMDTAPVIIESRTYVPLRFASQFLGLNVGWNGQTRTASIWNNEYKPENTDFIEPVISVKYNKDPTYPYYFDICLDNYKEYNDDYMFKLDFVNYPELNVREFPWDDWITVKENKWKPYYDIERFNGRIYRLYKTFYTTREKQKSFNIKPKMNIEFTIMINDGNLANTYTYNTSVPTIKFE